MLTNPPFFLFFFPSSPRRFSSLAGYKVTKIREPMAPHRLGLLFQVLLPEIKEDVRPIRRFMSAFEQRREIPNRAIQYLLVSVMISERRKEFKERFGEGLKQMTGGRETLIRILTIFPSSLLYLSPTLLFSFVLSCLHRALLTTVAPDRR